MGGGQRFGEKRAFRRIMGRLRGLGVRARIRNGHGDWAQLPTRSPGEHTTLGKVAERGRFELAIRISTPRWIRRVAAVCLSICGVMRRAAPILAE
jgi:hypothetical protein